MSNQVRAVRALAFVDLCGFTSYADVYGDDRAFDVMDAMRAQVRRATRARAVHVAKWLGDGAMLAAKDPAVLVASVIDARDGVARIGPLPLRAGLAMGSVILVDGDDYLGGPVNLASRLVGCAASHQVLATAEVARMAAAVASVRVVPPLTVQGLRQPVDVRELGGAGAPRSGGCQRTVSAKVVGKPRSASWPSAARRGQSHGVAEP